MKASAKLIFTILGCVIISIRSISSTSIDKSQITLRDNTPSNVIPNSYIIEFDDSSNDRYEKFMNSFVKSVKSEGIDYKPRETFNQKVFNGISIKLVNDKDIGKIKELKSVKNVWPVVNIPRAEFNIGEENNSNSQNLRDGIGFFDARDQSGQNCSEINVGIIDTGIDYKHPGLGGCFKSEGCKVKFGSDFVGDDFNGENDPKPDDDPLDECVGHGTHVAGIIAGQDSNKNITGIAPNVKLGAYRIFGCKGGTTNELIIKAMGKAFEDGMNIINLSLVSGDNAWFGGPESLAAEKLTKNGIFVVTSAGSSGDKGIFKVSSMSTAPGVISVASVDVEQINSFFIQPSYDPTSKIQYLTQDGKPVQLDSSLVTPTSDMTNSKNDACEKIEEDLTGKVALVRRGGCDDATKINIVQTARASAIVIYNDVSGIAMPEFDESGITIPVAMISCKDGVSLFNKIQQKNSITLQFTGESALINNPNTLKISAFSPFGPTNELDIKPDIAAPGSNILSTFPVSLGSFKSISGTSISAPFVTGALALYMQYKDKSTHKFIRNVIQNNAKPLMVKDSSVEKGSLIATTILQQGSGLINLADALTSTVVTNPSKLALKDSAHFNGKKRCLTLTNIGKETTKFTFNHLPAQSINGYDGVNLIPMDVPNPINSFANVKFSKSSIRLRPGESQDINLSFTPPKDENNLNHTIYSGYIVITDSLTKKNSYVSYMGMKGCLDTLPIFDSPFIQSGANDQKFTLPEDVLTVSMKDDDIVLLGARIVQGTKILTVDVIPADNDVVEPPTETKQPSETLPIETTTKTKPTKTKPTKTKTKSKSKKPTETQPIKTTTEKPTGTTTETPTETTTEKPTGTTTERTTTEKPTGTTTERTTTEKPKGTTTEGTATEKPTETTIEKPTGTTIEKPTGTTTEKPTGTTTEQPTGTTTEQPTGAQPTTTEQPQQTTEQPQQTITNQPQQTTTEQPQQTEQPQPTTTDDDVVIVTSTTTTTITPTPTPRKRSFIKVFKRGNDKLKSRAFDKSTTGLLVKNSLGTITNEGIRQFQPRNDNSENNQIMTLQFDGKVDKLDGTRGVELPDGKYRLFLAALKPFGNPKNKDDWETFTSSIIEIKRE